MEAKQKRQTGLTDMQTNRLKDGQTSRQTTKWIGRHTVIKTLKNRKTNSQKDRDTHIEWKISRQTVQKTKKTHIIWKTDRHNYTVEHIPERANRLTWLMDEPRAEFSTLEVAACLAMHLLHSITIWPNLELKTRPKQLLGSLPLDIVLPA